MTTPEFKIDPASTALVLIDLQKGIAALPVQGNSAASVLTNARALIDGFRAAGAPVVFVKVAFPVGASSLKPVTDAPPPSAPPAEPPGWSEFCSELGVEASDIVVLKRQWGAFYGTDLDLQLRRRGISTLVMAGIATSIGVDTTARGANERGYQQVFVEDAMSDLHAEMHAATVRYIFPRIGRVRTTAQVLSALK